MRVETQLSAFLENRAGVLAELAADLARHGISIRALTIANLVDHAVVRLVVSEPQKALHLLGDRGVLAVSSSVLALDMPDEPARSPGSPSASAARASTSSTPTAARPWAAGGPSSTCTPPTSRRRVRRWRRAAPVPGGDERLEGGDLARRVPVARADDVLDHVAVAVDHEGLG